MSRTSRVTRCVAATQAEVAGLLNVSAASVQRWMSIGCPGEEGNYEVLPGILQWLRTKGPWRPKSGDPEESDPLLSEAIDTPALERYRTARAKMVELEYEKACRTVMPVEDVRESFAGAAGHLRKLGESLAKQFGPAAQQMLNDGLDEYAKIIAAKFGDSPVATPVDGGISSEPDQNCGGSNGTDDEPVGGGRDLDSDRPEGGEIPPCESPC